MSIEVQNRGINGPIKGHMSTKIKKKIPMRMWYVLLCNNTRQKESESYTLQDNQLFLKLS